MRGALMLAFVTACYPRFDLDQPIALVPGASLSERQVEIVAAAASCWELGFGVPFIVDPHSAEPQQVGIDFGDFACVGRLGQYVPGLPAAIDLCPHAYGYIASPVDDSSLFLIVLHELGHASGIDEHARADAAILGSATSARLGSRAPLFSAEDVALFQAANGVRRELSCEVRLFAASYDSVPHCACAPACEPDVLEPNDLTEPAPLTADAELTLCVGDLDVFEVVAESRLVIESADPLLLVMTWSPGSGSRGQNLKDGSFTVDAPAGSFVSVQNWSYSRDTVTSYRIRFVPR